MGSSGKSIHLEWGRKLSAEEAAAYTDEIIKKMYGRWQERIFQGPFMRDLESGKLPLKTIRLFWQH